MTRQRDQAKKDNDAAIDKAYDQAIEIGENHPEHQNAIVGGMNEITQIATNVVGFVTDLISGLLGKITEIINGILKAVEQIAGTFGQVAGIIALI